MRSSIVKYRFCRRRHRAGDVQFSRPEFSPMVTACSNRLNWGRESVWWWWRKTAGVKFSCSKMALINIIVIKYNIINIVLTEEKKKAGSAQWEGRSGQNYFLMFFDVFDCFRDFYKFWFFLSFVSKNKCKLDSSQISSKKNPSACLQAQVVCWQGRQQLIDAICLDNTTTGFCCGQSA